MTHHSKYSNVMDMFPLTDSAKNAVDMFVRQATTDDINSILSCHVETVVVISRVNE